MVNEERTGRKERTVFSRHNTRPLAAGKNFSHTPNRSPSQLTLDVEERYGSEIVWRDGNYRHWHLNGLYGGNCSHYQKHPQLNGSANIEDMCRHNLKHILLSKDERIQFLEKYIHDDMEMTKKHRPRGMGCNYRVSLTEDIQMVLRVLAEQGDGVGRYTIRKRVNKVGWHPTDTALGGRISEALGELQGWLRMDREHKVVYDEDGFRYLGKTPIYFLTDSGRKGAEGIDTRRPVA